MVFVNHPVEEPEKSLRDYASPRCEDIKVQESDSKLEATKYENKSKIIEMVTATPFEGMATENPYRHIRHFTTLCNTVRQEGVPDEWFKWNLFPYSLTEEAKTWYLFASFEVEGNWNKLTKIFCEKFFPISKVQHLRRQVITFTQGVRCKALCNVGAQVSVLSSQSYDKVQDRNLDLAPTSTKLIMGDGRTIRPLGIACNMNVIISGKCIPTDFFVIDSYHSNHDHIILGRLFLKLVDAMLDAGNDKVTMNLNGKKYTYNFLHVSKHPSPFPPEDEEVEEVDSLCFVETLRDPLQRAMENQVNDQ
jgi:hypothetical protein